jgi:hypothetical protein
MGFLKNLRKTIIEQSILKSENPQEYARLAETGLLLGHPVKIKGHEKRSDNNIPYHTSIKFFNKELDKPEHAHEAASKLDHQHIDPKKVGIEPTKIKSREGDDIYVLKLHGPHAEKLKEHHDKFSHMGHKENYEFHPHISVSKETHDEIKSKGHKTAHDAGIEFGSAELRRGPKTLQTYNPKVEKTEPLLKPWSSQAQAAWGHSPEGKEALGGEKAVKEWDSATKGKHLPKHVAKSEELEKGALKNMLTAGAMAGALASATPTEAKNPGHQPLHPNVSSAQHPGYSREKLLNAISQVESSGGKNMNHKPTKTQGTAWGKFAEMPDVIHDTIRLNPDLKRQHGKALRLQGDNLHRYMQDNPKLEQLIADKHLSRLEHHFGNNPEAISFAWNQGISGTNRALKQKHDISSHPYVQKFKHYYESEK